MAFLPSSASAWLYEEHRAITALGIRRLDPDRQTALARLWGGAREAFPSRLCAEPSAGNQGEKPACVDLAAWPAVSGDHSCTPQELLRTVLESDWILRVAGVAARTQGRIDRARNEAERRNAQATGDLGMETADREYSTRAGSNNAHFLLPRSGAREPAQYAAEALGPDAEINAAAIYVLYHMAALRRGARLEEGPKSPPQRAGAAREVLALESFALHFLEDSFASGHVAGSWGNVAERKGTHDYYNEHGLDTENWLNEAMLLLGDGHLRAEDAERAGRAVERSLAEVLDALVPGSQANRDGRSVPVPAEAEDGTFDVCKSGRMPDWKLPPGLSPYLERVLRLAPVPFRGPGYGSLPRSRAEIGPFIGLASGVAVAGSGGGFTPGRSGGVQGVLDVGLRFGLGLDALLGDAGDGLLFVQGGVSSQTRSTAGCDPDCPADPLLQQFVPVVPARTGWSFRLRLPFWLIPGDLLLAAPLLAFTDPEALKKMGIRAADGGLIPWQRRIATPIGPVQFVAGREVSATLFGYTEKDAYLAVSNTPEGRVVEPIGIKSIQWEFPILEYRPFREYGMRYGFATFLQLGGGVDRPVQAVVIGRPDAMPPPVQTRYYGFIRIFFDGRRYF